MNNETTGYAIETHEVTSAKQLLALKQANRARGGYERQYKQDGKRYIQFVYKVED